MKYIIGLLLSLAILGCSTALPSPTPKNTVVPPTPTATTDVMATKVARAAQLEETRLAMMQSMLNLNKSTNNMRKFLSLSTILLQIDPELLFFTAGMFVIYLEGYQYQVERLYIPENSDPLLLELKQTELEKVVQYKELMDKLYKTLGGLGDTSVEQVESEIVQFANSFLAARPDEIQLELLEKYNIWASEVEFSGKTDQQVG